MSIIKSIPFPFREMIRRSMYGSSPNTDIVKSMAKEKGTGLLMIDVGAETGYEAIVAAKNGFRVYAFEPDERTFDKLKWNVNAEKADNIELVKKGAGAKDGRVTLYFGKNETGRSSIIADDNLDQNTTIELVRLDTFCKAHQLKPDYIKIDAEGVSFEVLQSYDFSCHQPAFILIEPDDDNEADIKAFLSEKGYEVFHSVFRAKKKGERTILKRYAYAYDKAVEFADIVAVHKNSRHLWTHKVT